MTKAFPNVETEAFVATADLSEYDFSDLVLLQFELKRKDVAGTPRSDMHTAQKRP